MIRNHRRLWAVAAVALLSACTAKPKHVSQDLPEKLTLEQTSFPSLAGWQDDRQSQALQAFQTSCTVFMKKQDDATVGQGALASEAREWKTLCAEAALVPPGDDRAARVFFEQHFTPYEAANNGRREGLFTGYYEPMLNGSLTLHDRYRVPVYRTPPDLVKGSDAVSRQRIDEGSLANQGLEIAWVDDAVDLFFLQIQGSGRLKLDDGREMRLAYSGQNGHEYVAIGKLLKERGLLPPEKISMASIKGWLRDHPNEAQALMWENPSYVFFSLNESDPGPDSSNTGPKGAQGVPLTTERSFAVDKRYIPYGMPIYVETTLPSFDANRPEGERFQQLMVAQDTGGAIKGPVRGDVFFGHGVRAETLAGYMKQKGQWNVLVPNSLAQRLGKRAG